MSSQRQITLCREGVYFTVVAMAVLIGAVSRQLNLLMLLGCVLTGPLVFSLLYGRLALRRLSIDRKLPALLQAGERLRVDVTVTNRRRLFNVWGVQVEDSVVREAGADDENATVAVYFPCVRAAETSLATYDGRLPLRGRYRFGPLQLSTRFPLGLLRHSRRWDDSADLLVHPRLGTLNRNWAQMIREHEAGTHRLSRRGLLEADFYGLREWRAGDSRRWIHWRTSARRGALIVRQFEQRRSQNVALLVDLWQPASPDEDDLRRTETAVSLVATLIAEVSRQPGARLTLDMAANEPLHRSGPVTPLFFREQMDALALAAAHHEGELPDFLGHALALVPAATPTFVISTRTIDWDGLARGAAQRQAELAGRKLQGICVADDSLSSYFQLAAE